MCLKSAGWQRKECMSPGSQKKKNILRGRAVEEGEEERVGGRRPHAIQVHTLDTYAPKGGWQRGKRSEAVFVWCVVVCCCSREVSAFARP